MESRGISELITIHPNEDMSAFVETAEMSSKTTNTYGAVKWNQCWIAFTHRQQEVTTGCKKKSDWTLADEKITSHLPHLPQLKVS